MCFGSDVDLVKPVDINLKWPNKIRCVLRDICSREEKVRSIGVKAPIPPPDSVVRLGNMSDTMRDFIGHVP